MIQRIVVKLGTSVLTGGTPHLDRAHMVDLVRQCAVLHRQGRDVILCTSGAIAVGRERLGIPDLPPTIATKQMLAAVGQSRLMLVWESLFEIYDIHVGQMLLTRADVSDRDRFLNARDALHALLEHRIIPIVNENDAVATAEIKVGDNDNLSALVALLAEADLLLMLTDQPGLFTGDPRSDPGARLIPEVHTIDETLRKIAGGSASGLGVGGMATKLEAADVARRAGTDVVIAAGRAPDVILRAADGEPVGTLFPALEAPLENRKRWIFGGTTPGGRLVIDAGAARALVEKGSSLLPAGITRVEGSFERGDTVLIVEETEETREYHPGAGTGRGAAGPLPVSVSPRLRVKELARGIVRYGSVDLAQILGLHSDQIPERLGYTAGAAAVHRNDMILL
jgi:glutamate 5-kinase